MACRDVPRSPTRTAGTLQVAANVSGITWAACAAAMEAALRRRLDGVIEVAISQRAQTAAVVFAPAEHFSPHAFHDAAAEADVSILSLSIDACGTLHRMEDRWWFTAARDKWSVREPPPTAGEGTLCLTGALVQDGEEWVLERVMAIPAHR